MSNGIFNEEALREIIRDVVGQVLAEKFGGVVGDGAATVKRKPGRPAGSTGKKVRRSAGSSESCGVIGCRNAPKSVGYCSSHYQKLNLMVRKHPTEARRDGWRKYPKPQSVIDTKLPRGRGGAVKADLKKKAARITRKPKVAPKPSAPKAAAS